MPHRNETRRRGLAVEAELREVRSDPDHVVAGIDKGANGDVDRRGRARRHRDGVDGDAGKVDILGGALANIGVAEVRHVAETPDEPLAARRGERLDDDLRRFEWLSDGEIGDGALADTSAQPFAFHEHAADPATILELRARPARDTHQIVQRPTRSTCVPETPPVCQLNG